MANDEVGEADRLEALWAGTFGDEYMRRNADSYGHRERFWAGLHERLGFRNVLEVGCNVGGNLEWLEPRMAPGSVYGVDINGSAITRLKERLPVVNAITSAGREIPFRDRWFELVFTMGVLIHQPELTLPIVMSEMVRTSSRFVLCGEYYAESTTEVPYRGQSAALFKRDYGGLFTSMFPGLELVERGFLSRDEGWDDITWWLFERN